MRRLLSEPVKQKGATELLLEKLMFVIHERLDAGDMTTTERLVDCYVKILKAKTAEVRDEE